MPETTPSAPSSTGLAEAFVLWMLFGVVAVSIAVTYTRTPVRELYHVTGGGPAAGARAVLGFAGFPAGLTALAVLPLILDRLRRRVILAGALVAAGLATTTFLPGALGDDRIDARPPNVFAALGVALTFLLTIAAARTVGTGRSWRRQPGDRIRLCSAQSYSSALCPGSRPCSISRSTCRCCTRSSSPTSCDRNPESPACTRRSTLASTTGGPASCSP